jgi:hypothetical protein
MNNFIESTIEETDPKGFPREPASCRAGESCKSRPESGKKTFRVFDLKTFRVL